MEAFIKNLGKEKRMCWREVRELGEQKECPGDGAKLAGCPPSRSEFLGS